MKRTWIPNALTLGNLFFGCVALVAASAQDIQGATLAIGIALALDVLDGWAARKLGVTGPLGAQLDSLADAVTFGVAPAFLLFHLWISPTLHPSLAQENLSQGWQLWSKAVGIFVFSIALSSVYRLAKFTIDTRQKTSFIGLPTPANALWVLGYSWGLTEGTLPVWAAHPLSLTLFIALSSYAMNAPWPLFAFKSFPKGWWGNRFRLLLAVLSAFFLAFYGMTAWLIVVPLYIVCSLLENRFHEVSRRD